MSKAKQETIADIVREMRTLGRLDGESTDKIPRSLQALGLRTYADRIEAAHKQLRAALKPVLDISIDMNTSDLAMAMAIKEAKRIYNEGRESEAK